MMIYARVRHGTRSYEIVDMLLSKLFPNRADLVVVDLTYGVGRFYRLARKRIKHLIAVDIEKHEWEVKPDVFYRMPCQLFVEKVIRGEIDLPKPSIVVVDPPWSREKRGKAPSDIGISMLPYHIRYVDSWSIIASAMNMSKHFDTALLYRYHNVLPCDHIARVDVLVNIMGHKGFVYYGVCKHGTVGGNV
jgi:hypothetical protein